MTYDKGDVIYSDKESKYIIVTDVTAVWFVDPMLEYVEVEYFEFHRILNLMNEEDKSNGIKICQEFATSSHVGKLSKESDFKITFKDYENWSYKKKTSSSSYGYCSHSNRKQVWMQVTWFWLCKDCGKDFDSDMWPAPTKEERDKY